MTDQAPGALLREIVSKLHAASIPHMVVGSFASTFHGEPRTTRGLDLVIDPDAAKLDALLVALDPDRFYVDREVARDALRRRTMSNVIEIASAWKLDLVIRKARPFSIEELRRRAPVVMFGSEVDTATAEDTIVAKLEWAALSGSDRQLEDVAGILRVQGERLDLAYIEHWVGQLGLTSHWDRARRS